MFSRIAGALLLMAAQIVHPLHIPTVASAPPPAGISDTGRGCQNTLSVGNTFSCTMTGADATTPGNFIICRSSFNPDSVSFITDSNGDTVERFDKESWNSTNTNTIVYYVKNSSGGTHTITITLGSGTPYNITCNELVGASKTTPIDPASGTGLVSLGTGSPLTGPSITTSGANEFLYTVFAAADGAATFTSTSGDTAFTPINGTTFEVAFWRNLATSGTYSANATTSSSAQTIAFTVAIQP